MLGKKPSTFPKTALFSHVPVLFLSLFPSTVEWKLLPEQNQPREATTGRANR